MHGASVANYVRFLDFVRQTGAETVVRAADSITGEEFEVRAKHIVSATGPWTDGVWEKEQGYDGVPRLTTQRAKGIHILVPRRAGQSLRHRDAYPFGEIASRKTAGYFSFADRRKH